MDIKEIMYIQNQFDETHKSNFEWSQKISEDNIDMIKFLTIALSGEVGELSNLIKKIIRGDSSIEDVKDQIQEELADIFIYTVKFCNQMSIDLEAVFLDKHEKNKQRFKHYEKKQVR